jgi:AcrR family transcriptional regulator
MSAGRPREFDYDHALDSAMRVFWSKGYEGTSMQDLTDAMHMNRPSIYASFGNKEELFCKALERYAQNSAAFFKTVLDQPTLKLSIEKFLLGSADSFTSSDHPNGCFAVQGALVVGGDSALVKQEALLRREAVVEVLKERIQKAIAEGELIDGTDAEELARFFVAVLQGMAVQSHSQLTCSQLRAIAERALLALPVEIQ